MAAWKQKNRDQKMLEQRRKDATRLILNGISRGKVASSLGVSYTSVENWWRAYLDAGGSMKALEARDHTGKPAQMNRNQKRRLERMLLKGAEHYGFETDIWTTDRVAALIKEKFKVEYHRDHVRKILHSLGLSWKKVEGVARERDEGKVRDWVQDTLPDIKKSG